MRKFTAVLLSLFFSSVAVAQTNANGTTVADTLKQLSECAKASADQIAATNTNIAKPETSCYAGAVGCGQTATGRISVDSCDASGMFGVGYSFSGTAGQQVTIVGKATSYEFKPVVGLGDGHSGNSTIYASAIASSTYGSATISSFTLPYTGPYNVLIMASTSYSFGNYSLSVTCYSAPPPPPPTYCTPDSRTACLLNGRFKATLRYRGAFDNTNADTDALVKPVSGFSDSSYETVFFYFNSANNIEMMLKMLDQGNTNSAGQPTIAVLFGSATPLRTELVITDTTNGATKRYSSQFSSQAGNTDFTAFVK